MHKWHATIIGPGNSAHDCRIYNLTLQCGEDYPEKPPRVKFVTRINMNCVDNAVCCQPGVAICGALCAVLHHHYQL